MKIIIYCTQGELERAKEAYAAGESPCTAVHCPFGNDSKNLGCHCRCPLTWMNNEERLDYLEQHIYY